MVISILVIYCCQSNQPQTQWLMIIIIVYLFAHDSTTWVGLGGDSLIYSLRFPLGLEGTKRLLQLQVFSAGMAEVTGSWPDPSLCLFMWTLHGVSLDFHVNDRKWLDILHGGWLLQSAEVKAFRPF